MTTPTPAAERAALAMQQRSTWRSLHWGMKTDLHRGAADAFAAVALTAALADPDDPDSLARALFVLDAGMRLGITAESAMALWEMAPNEREHWRAVADGLRMMLTGSGA